MKLNHVERLARFLFDMGRDDNAKLPTWDESKNEALKEMYFAVARTAIYTLSEMAKFKVKL